MRVQTLGFLLGLIFAGACSSAGQHRTEPTSSASGAKQPESSVAPTQPVAAMKEKTRDDSASAAKDEQKERKVEFVEEKYDNGVVRKRAEGYRNAEGEFVSHGLTSTWYESGLQWTETSYRDGIKHGPQRKWYNTGAEWSVGSYDNGVEDGLWTAYHPNGEKAREFHLNHGVWNGPYIEYHKNGRKNMEVMFVQGVRQGISKVYDEDGSVAIVTDYIDGVEQP